MRIFLSYRREDASAWAGRLRDALAARFGEDEVFQDVVAVRPGQDFTGAIDDALGKSDIVLVVIGPDWSTASRPDGEPRLDDPGDYVRYELRAALDQGRPVIPVLVGGAKMPGRAQLPEDLAALAVLQAVTLRDESWHRDVEGLLESLGADAGPAGPRRRRWAALALAVVGVAAAGVVGAILLDRDGSDASSGDGGDPVTSTSFDPFSLRPQCPSPTGADWTSLGFAGSDEIGPEGSPAARVAVVAAHHRPAGGEGWELVLGVEYTNLVDASQRQYSWYYELTTQGLTSDPHCFSVVGGQDPACCGETAELLIGFTTTADPQDGGALLVEVNANRGRIELAAPG